MQKKEKNVCIPAATIEKVADPRGVILLRRLDFTSKIIEC